MLEFTGRYTLLLRRRGRSNPVFAFLIKTQGHRMWKLVPVFQQHLVRGPEFEVCSWENSRERRRENGALVIIITVLCVWTGSLHSSPWSHLILTHNPRKRHEHLHFRNEAPKVKCIFIKHRVGVTEVRRELWPADGWVQDTASHGGRRKVQLR